MSMSASANSAIVVMSFLRRLWQDAYDAVSLRLVTEWAVIV